MNRIIDLLDNVPETRDPFDCSERGWGIAGRFTGFKLNMRCLKLETNILNGGHNLDIQVQHERKSGATEWSEWNVGCQSILTILFESGEIKKFDKNDYETSDDYKKAVYEFFNKYIKNGFRLEPIFEIYDGPDCLEI